MIEAALILARSGWAQLRRGRGGAAPPRAAMTIRESYMVLVAAYCLVGSLVGGAILWGIERSHGTGRPFVDCLFSVASAASSTGLITLDSSTLQTGSNVVLLVAMLMYANTLLVSTMPVCIRLRRARAARERWRAAEAALLARERELAEARHVSVDEVIKSAGLATLHEVDELGALERVARVRDDIGSTLGSALATVGPRAGVAWWKPGGGGGGGGGGGTPGSSAPPTLSRSAGGKDSVGGTGGSGGGGGTQGTLSRGPPSAAAVADALLAVELRAHAAHTRALAAFEAGPDLLGYRWLLACAFAYYATVLLAGFVLLSTWLTYDADAAAIMAANQTPAGNTVTPWFAFYTTVSLFTNTGMMMLRDSYIQFARDSQGYMFAVSGAIAALGFSFYPVGLRVFLLVVHAACPGERWAGGRHRAALRDILDNPRKYTTHLFSHRGTIATALAAGSAHVALWFVYLIFNFNSPYFAQWSGYTRGMIGWFNAVMVTNAGFNAYDLSMLSVGTQVFYVVCMYLTARPFFLGIYVTASEAGVDESGGDVAPSMSPMWAVLRDFGAMLRSDAWVLALLTTIICLADSDNILSAISGPQVAALGTGGYLGVFPIVFDLVSGYGNVGLSLGYPGTTTSTCAMLSPFSKLCVAFACLFGYCGGIAPTSLSLYELPRGVEGVEPESVADERASAKEIAALIDSASLEEVFQISSELLRGAKAIHDAECTASVPHDALAHADRVRELSSHLSYEGLLLASHRSISRTLRMHARAEALRRRGAPKGLHAGGVTDDGAAGSGSGLTDAAAAAATSAPPGGRPPRPPTALV